MKQEMIEQEHDEFCKELQSAKTSKDIRRLHQKYKKKGGSFALFQRYPDAPYIMSCIALVFETVILVVIKTHWLTVLLLLFSIIFVSGYLCILLRLYKLGKG